MNQIINHKGKHYFKTKNGYKEILSSTDSSLGLPQPSQQFIEKYIKEYNKGNIFTDVMVECEEIINPAWESYFEFTDYCMKYGYDNQWYSKEEIKVNSDTINIKPIKTNWSREEVINLLKERDNHIQKYFSLKYDLLSINEWIEENL